MTGDPLYDFMVWDRHQYKLLKHQPTCCYCGQHITDEYGYHMGNEWYCESCINSFREWLDIYASDEE